MYAKARSSAHTIVTGDALECVAPMAALLYAQGMVKDRERDDSPRAARDCINHSMGVHAKRRIQIAPA